MNAEQIRIFVIDKGGLSAKFTRLGADVKCAIDAQLHLMDMSNYCDWPISRKLWHIMEDSNLIPQCKVCTIPVNWNRTAKVYNTYCSNACIGKDPYISNNKKRFNNTNAGKIAIATRIAASKSTMSSRYGTPSFFASAQFKRLNIKHDQSNRDKSAGIAALDAYRNSPDYVHPMHTNEIKTKLTNTTIRNLGIDGVCDSATLKKFLDIHHHHHKKTLTEISNEYNIPISSLSKWASKLDVVVHPYYTSYEQLEIYNFLIEAGVTVELNNRSIISGELDLYLPDYDLAIEYCGLYWHSDLYKDKNYHKRKYDKCNSIGIRLITIFQNEWIENRELIKTKLLHIIGISTGSKIYARKCNIVEPTTREVRHFMDTYHIQGYGTGGKYTIGLVHDSKLVAVMSFKKENKLTDSVLLERYATSEHIVGGFSKLLKHATHTLNKLGIIKISTFADLRWSRGQLYIDSGFVEVSRVKPDYAYIRNARLYHKFNFRHKKLKNITGYDPTISESQNTKNMNIHKIYDCGKIKYEISL